MYDNYNRKITYLRISVTDRCNHRCIYCAGTDTFKKTLNKDILSYEQIKTVVQEAAAIGITKVKLTGGEPLIKRDIETLVGYLAEIPGINEVTLTTNATRLKEKAFLLKQKGLSRINISLDSLKPANFTKITGGGNISDTLEGIKAAQQAGFKKIKINMVVIKGINEDEIDDFRIFCEQNGLELQLIKHFLLSEKKIVEKEPGFDRPPSCSECNKIRILSDGTLKPCLFSNHELKIDMNNIRCSLIKTIESKPECGHICTTRTMDQIGG